MRVTFGLVMAIDAALKWQPGFSTRFVSDISSMEAGQPQFVKDWLHGWVSFLNIDPTLFVHIVAIGETCLAIGLIFGLFSNATYLVGVGLSLCIWSTGEGFGGPYNRASTDIGTAIIYAFMFATLYFGHASTAWSLDRHIWDRLGRWKMIATRPTATE
jgi:uncharacterized membrane protein YphA (DoxX/SURF4 family)